MTPQLPYIDEHVVDIATGVDQLWAVLVETLDRTFSRAPMAHFARIVGCADATAAGPRPLSKGSTVSGFRVVVASPGAEIVLEGSHRFSAYALTFRLEQVSRAGSRLRAESRASFPGLTGGAYRMLVIGTGGHKIAVRRYLSLVKRVSEARTRSHL